MPSCSPRPAEPERFRPRDLRNDTEEGRLLLRLEVPDCGCPAERDHSCSRQREGDGCPPVDECPCCSGTCRCPVLLVHGCKLRRLRKSRTRCARKAECDCCCPAEARCPCCEGDCDCPYLFTPCEHARPAGGDWPEGLTYDEWHELLQAFDLAGYAGPPPPKRPARALSRQALLNLYDERAAFSLLAIRHRDDLTPDDCEKIGIQAGARRTQLRLFVAGNAVEDTASVRRLTLAETWERPEATADDMLRAWRAGRAKANRPERRAA